MLNKTDPELLDLFKRMGVVSNGYEVPVRDNSDFMARLKGDFSDLGGAPEHQIKSGDPLQQGVKYETSHEDHHYCAEYTWQ